MKGVFKITRAEFSKIFKKPIVYIMVFVLALVSVFSIIFIKPNERANDLVQIDANSANDCYNVFNGNSDVSKLAFDKTYEETSNSIEFYNKMYKRVSDITYNYSKVQDAFQQVKKYKNSQTEKSTLIQNCNNSINAFLISFNDIASLSSYENVYNILTEKNDDNELYYQTHHIDEKKYFNYNTLLNFYNNTCLTYSSTSNIDDYIVSLDTNNYIGMLGNLADYGTGVIKNNLVEMLDTIQSQNDYFVKLIIENSQTGTVQNDSTEALTKLYTLLTSFKEKLDNLIVNDNYLYAIVTSADYLEFTTNYNFVIEAITNSKDQTGIYTQEAKITCAKKLQNSSAIKNMKAFLNKVNFLNIDSSLINEFTKISEQVNSNKETILKKIDELKGESKTSNIIKQITNYKMLGEVEADLINQLVLQQFSNTISANQISNTKNNSFDLSTFNTYENNQNISQNKYQINNNIYSYELGTTFSFGSTTGHKNSMYDSIYISLKISTIVIIVFTIMMIASLITSETENGTIKLLLLRPYKRSKILFGKMLATLFFSFIFLIISVAISGTVGFFVYGVGDISKVLVTFNATKTFLINPILLLALFFLSCMLDITFYLVLSLTISVLFRSYIGAITTSFLTYVGAVVVGAFIPTSSVYAYLPFTNISLFRYFGGELLSSVTSKGALFISTPVHSLQSIFSSLLIGLISVVVLLTTSLITFNKRDF